MYKRKIWNKVEKVGSKDAEKIKDGKMLNKYERRMYRKKRDEQGNRRDGRIILLT